jgi:hypothetical protein
VIAYYPKQSSSRAAAFAWMVPHLTEVARQFGYAIGLHGSMSRDLDLIAVPWTEAAAPAETLVEAIRDAVGGFIRNDPPSDGNKYDETTRNPSEKPHGRRAWSIEFSGHRFYIDLSVMPRASK